MVYLTFLILAIGLIAAIALAAIQAYWWQVKEYRLDRMLTWLRYNRGWREFLRFQLRRPTPTVRSFIILFSGLGLSLIGGLLMWPRSAGLWQSLWVLTLPLWAVAGVWGGVALSAPFVWWLTQRTIKPAALKVWQVKPRVIAITGSMGKSSAKEFLSQLLGDSFATVKTLKSENTPLGVARRILKSLKNDTQILIVEMGAYRKGEIQALCRMVPPDIAWITGLGSQHLGLFGSEKNLQDAKYELVEGLKPRGLVVIHGGHSEERLVNRAKAEGRNPITYGVKSSSVDVQATVGSLTPKGFQLKVAIDNQPVAIPVSLRGAHFAPNLIGALIIANRLGVDQQKLAKSFKAISQPAGSLEVIRLKSGARLILNRFNTSVEGFMASAEYLKLFAGKKYILTPGIIELGKDTRRLHQWLGRKLRPVETVFVTNKLHGLYLKDGGVKVIVEENHQKMAAIIAQTIKRGTSLLVEGRISEDLYKRLLAL